MTRAAIPLAVILAATVPLGFVAVTRRTATPVIGQEKKPVDGKESYQQNCAFCHGKEGKGDGPAAYLLWPKPRNFTRGLFKIKSTPSGEMPTDDDLFRTITDGMPGSAMLAWKWMPEEERRALVQEVKRLSFMVTEDDEKLAFFELRPPAKPLELPAEPPSSEKTILRGKEWFFRLQCNKCHGNEGKGDGPSSEGMKDDWGFPISPRNFTGGAFKGGQANRDLYLRIAGGIAGTPMPAFQDSQIPPQERWALVHFVRSLAQRPSGRPAAQAVEGELVCAKLADGDVPTLPEDTRWEKVPAKEIPLIQLFQHRAAPDTLAVRAVHDGTRISFLLEWEDATINVDTLKVQQFRDGAAIQFAPKGPSTPLMGAVGLPVNIWHWKADWQVDLGSYRDVENAYPGMQMDMYPQTYGDQTESHRGKPPSAQSTDKTFITGAAAGNGMSRLRRTTPVEDLSATGFGTLTPHPESSQDVQGCGAWMGGKWRVVFTRVLKAKESGDQDFVPGQRIVTSFACWNGEMRDRDGQKSVTTWYWMRLE